MSNIKKINSIFNGRMNKKIEEFSLKRTAASVGDGKDFNFITLREEGLETIEFLYFDCTSVDISSPWRSDSAILIDRLGYVRKNGIDTKTFWDGTISSENKSLRLKIRNICGDDTVYEIVNN